MERSKYSDIFNLDSGGEDKKLKLEKAFKQVSDIRKFEIELYWKRATYFWTLISVSFIGYFSMVSSSSSTYKFSFSLVISLVGLVLAIAWFLANKGSKFWQENWENHMDLLEDEITGPLYKTVLLRYNHNKIEEIGVCERYITGPQEYSVSKINQWVGFFIILIWIGLVSFSFYKTMFPIDKVSVTEIVIHVLIVLFSVCMIAFMSSKSKRHKEIHKIKSDPREVILID
ncbi:hypothetical protein [Pectobacterium polonicum]|uniref:RipA family octameric membrane protein n=1 Tax=Pectobacterium polonicum TaxID=2485124 RepID=UPI002B246A5A|nr:hypothetical protein [Pectobacterium polonicum]